jgi:hypothetical protein
MVNETLLRYSVLKIHFFKMKPEDIKLNDLMEEELQPVP